MTPVGRRIAVVGLGLIGGSLARRLAGEHEVVGYDADPATCDLAQAAGLSVESDLGAAVAHADVVFLAVALDGLPTAVGELAGLLPAGAVLSDVGSVKQPVYAAVREHGLAGRFVGGHPMAGSERSGFAASDPGLYDDAAWVLCLEPDTDLTAWQRLAQLLVGIGARVVPATAADHDAAVARISHLPHLLAAALAATAAEAGPLTLTLAAGSFRDGTRVAATPPALPVAMCRANSAHVQQALADVIEWLRTAGDDPQLLIDAGHLARRRWANRSLETVSLETVSLENVAVDSPRVRSELLRIGRVGGCLLGISGGQFDVQLPAPG